MSQNEQSDIQIMRHSTAHVFATAVMTLWPEARLGVGPAVENGFYYDVDIPGVTISDTDFKTIEKEMRKVIGRAEPFERSMKTIDDALVWAKTNKQVFKEELLNDLAREGTTVAKDLDSEMLGVASDGSKVDEVSFYTNGTFCDLCRGPHVEHTGKIGAFKLMRVGGVYWRGKDTNPQMQRVYGAAFTSDKELNEHLQMLEEAKKRDHRKLGVDLDLFTFSELVGPGLPLWTPRGTILKTELDKYVQELRDQAGFMPVTVPHITKKDLYEKSGHWAKFSDELFKITTREGHTFVMKPMNCPHHTQIYDARQRSYRDLPIRYRESTMVYRDEQSGELGGLSRVRSITQDDAHIFCRYSQVEQEVSSLWDIVETFYATVGIELRLRLSLHDPEDKSAYMGTVKQWEDVEGAMRNIATSRGVEFTEGVGEAAFYGPKFDFMGKDAIGREHQVATIQFDFNQPEGFDLTCVNEEGEKERIVMVHCAVMGSHERFLSVYIEHTAGRFPLWCAPEQVRVLTVNQTDEIVAVAENIVAKGKAAGLRITLDNNKDSVGKKIRESELWKVPYTLVIGEKEAESGEVSPRIRADMQVGDPTSMKVDNFIQSILNESVSRVSRSSI